MADNFNLRAFLSENKLTKNAQLLKESTVLNGKSVDLTSIEVDGNYPSDVYIISADFEDKTPLSDEEIQQLEKEYPNLAGEVGFDKQTSGFDHDEDYGVDEAKDGTWKKGDFYSRDYVEQTYPDKVKEIEGNIEDEEDRNPNIWDLYTSLETPEEVEDFVKDYINETTNTMTTREQKLVKMVQEAMGTFTDLSQDQFGLGDKIKPIVPPQDIEEGEDIVEEKPLPKYESVEDLMKEIEHGTNKAMYEYKISEMKRIAKQLEEKVTTLEESEHAAHINPADVKKMKKDILTLHKGVAKIEKEYDRKFNKKTKTSEPKKEEAEKGPVALAENRRKRLLKSRILSENRVSLVKRNTNTMENFDLKKFLVENKLTTNSRLVKEYIEADEESVAEAFQQAGIDLTQPVHVVETRSVGAGGEQDEPYTVPAQTLLAKLEKDRAEYNNSNNESGVQYDYDAANYFSAEENGLPENVTAKLSVVFGDEHEYVIFQ